MGNYNDYKGIMLKTINGDSFYFNKHKMDSLKQIIKEDPFFEMESYKLDEINILELIKDDEKNSKLLTHIEMNEFEKPYFYGMMYAYEGNIVPKNIESINDKERDILTKYPKYPKLFENEEFIYLKFSLVVTDVHGFGEKIKYPVICKFYKKEKCMVMHFDTLRDRFQSKVTENGKIVNVYSKIATNVESWLSKNLNIELTNYSVFTSSSIFCDTVKEREDLEEFTEYSNDKRNGNQKLRADKDGKLPFFGELEETIEALPNKDSRDIMKKFLKKHRNTNDYYQRGFTWLFEKNKNMKVEFKKSIFNDGRDLIHFHSHNLKSGRVDYVIRDIVEAGKLYKKQNESEAESTK